VLNLEVDGISHADHWKHSLGWQIRPLFMSISNLDPRLQGRLGTGARKGFQKIGPSLFRCSGHHVPSSSRLRRANDLHLSFINCWRCQAGEAF
jgi:hypothetical protein